MTIVLFAAGALTYAAHPEGILEYNKRRWTMRFERLLFAGSSDPPSLDPGQMAGAGGGATHHPVVGTTVDTVMVEPLAGHDPGSTR